MVERELVTRQLRALVDMEHSGVVPMLQQDKFGDLARMYGLFRRVEGGFDLLRQVGLNTLVGVVVVRAFSWD